MDADGDDAAAPLLDLVVLRSADLSAARAFYEALGVVFGEEQHGSGPRHLAGRLGNGVVLELYPATQTGPVAEGRLGFVVHDVAVAVRAVCAAGGTIVTEGGARATVADPDGRRVDLTAAVL